MEIKIVTIPDCSKCKMLKAENPETPTVEVNLPSLLVFAQQTGIKSMPFLIVTGEPTELSKIIKGANEK